MPLNEPVQRVAELLPGLKSDLKGLVRMPSVSAPGEVSFELLQTHDVIVDLFEQAGVEVGRLALPGTAPLIVGGIPAPPGAPTVLLYCHYDVVDAGDESLWHTPAFRPHERDGAIYGRGAADSKGNLMTHLGALRAWGGRPPVGIKLCIEGHGEVGSGALLDYPALDPELFRCDTMVIAGVGNVAPGVPTLTTKLFDHTAGRGFAARTDGPAYAAARRAWASAFDRSDVTFAGFGEPIPIVGALAGALPDAEVLVVGTIDGEANMHAANERVLLSELERTVLAETTFFDLYAQQH